MRNSIKLILSGVIVISVSSFSGCSGSGSSSGEVYYSNYHNPYPGGGYYGRRTVYVDHRPGHKPPIARPPGGSRPPSMGRPSTRPSGGGRRR